MRAQLIGNGLLLARVPEHLVALLSALQLQGASPDPLLSLDDAGWHKVLRLCDRLQLTLPLALLPSAAFPSWVDDRLRRNLTDNARRFQRVQATYREAAAALDHARVPHLVLKGFAQSPDFVRSPQFRKQGDIDFYLPGEYVRTAAKALEGIGYEPAGPAEDYRHADHSPTLIRFRGWKPGANLFDPEMPLALELHHCLWNAAVSLIQLPETEDFWNRRIDRRIGDLSFPALCPVDHLGYFALHLLRDLLAAGPLLHHALELAGFLHQRADDSTFWGEWEARYSQRLKRTQAITFALVSAGFSGRLSPAVQNQIEHLPPEQRVWIELCGGDLLTGAFSRNRDGRLLQFLLSESPDARRRILWRVVSPGEIASPQKLARRRESPAVAQRAKMRRWSYPAYLASRVALNGAAVLRCFSNALAIFVSSSLLRRNAAASPPVYQ